MRAAADKEPTLASCDLVDPSIRRRLGNRAALGVTLILASAVGATTATGLWVSIDSLRGQAEEAGRRTAVTAATAFGTLAEPSAANIARTLDIVLDEQLRAQAAATGMLVEAAESAGHGAAYIEDALRQIASRSPIRRIDVTADDGPSYSTGQSALRVDELEPAFARLATTHAQGRTAATAATQTRTGLTKAAAAQPMHRPAAVRIEQELDGLTAARTYGAAGDRQARELAHDQAEAIARLTTHAIELAEDAGWGRRRIEERLDRMARDTAIERIVATGADGSVVYRTGRGNDTGAKPRTQQDQPRNDGNETSAGRYDSPRRWIARAGATRANRRLNATVEIATRAGRGGLAESAWQNEANRLAGVEGMTGVWVAQVDSHGVRLAAAAPGPGRGTAGATDAWTRWNEDLRLLAAETAGTGDTRSRTAIRLLRRQPAIVRTAARGTNSAGQPAIAVVIEQRADAVLDRMRRDAGAGLAAATALIALLGIGTTWGTRRWLTAPIEAVAGAARCLENGERPPAGLMAGLRRRDDEIGGLARTFEAMSAHVLARHDELSTLVAQRTRWLQEANAKLTGAQERIERELQLAKTVQEALVPAGAMRAGNVTLASRMTPARELGGDFVDVHPRNGHELFVAVCDVSGKGVAAALFMAVAQAAVAGAAARNRDVSEIAADANRRLCAGNPLGMFVTGFLAAIDTQTGRLEYVCAGHEPPICVKRDGRIEKLDRLRTIPFGLEADERYDEREHVMDPGETIIAYTDGIPDACNRGEELFGEQRLEELARDAPDDDPADTIQRIWTAVDLFSGPAAATDDKTCMVIRNHREG